MRGSVVLYYFRYYVGREGLFSAFNVLGTLATIAGILFSKGLSLRYGKRNVFIAIAIKIACVHHHPATSPAFRTGGSGELQSALILQIDETLGRRLLEVRIVRNRRNIQVSIAIEVPRQCLVCAVHRIMEHLAEVIRAIIEVNANAVIRLQRKRKVTVVAVGHNQIQPAVLVKVHQIKSRQPPARRDFQQRLDFELAATLIEEQVNPLACLRHHYDDVGPTVAVEVANLRANRPRTIQQHVLLVTAAFLALKP